MFLHCISSYLCPRNDVLLIEKRRFSCCKRTSYSKSILFILGVQKNFLSLHSEKLTSKRMRRLEIVKQIKQTIEKTEPTATTILYGSEARGDARADSDIDVLILLEGDKRNLRREEEISGALYDLELNTGVLISPMIILRKQWENRPFKTPFYVNVMNEGIKL